nr:hypothetical protein [Clostridiales bacterium]
MKSKAFSKNFIRTMKTEGLIPALIFLVLFVFQWYSMVIIFVLYSFGTSARVARDVEGYKYIFSKNTTGHDIEIQYFSIIVLSVLFAIVLFRFIADKKTVNVYYSLGISRKNMFLSKYFAGALMIFLSMLIPFLIFLIPNRLALGASKELYITALYYFSSYFVVSMFSFTLSALVFCFVGTISEGVVYSFVFLAFPTVLLYSLDVFVKSFCFGTAYGNTIYIDKGIYSEKIKPSFIEATHNINPILFPLRNLAKYIMADGVKTESGFKVYLDKNQEILWTAPDFKPVIIWAVITVAIAFLAVYAFRNRKAEICGFRGKNKVMNTLITIVAGFGVFSAVTLLVKVLPKALTIAIATLAYLAVFFLLECYFNIGREEYKKGLKKLPVHIVFLFFMILFVSTNLFGTGDKLPKFEDIESIIVSEPLEASGIFANYNGASYNLTQVDVSFQQYVTVSGNYTTDNDKRTILELNKKISYLSKSKRKNKPEEDSAVAFIYKLKNGKEVVRFYDYVVDDIPKEFFCLQKTDYY